MDEKIHEKTDKPAKPEPADQIAITRHRAKIGRREIAYTVTCGTLVLKEEAEKDGKSEGEKARAKVFFIAYTLDDPGSTTTGAGSPDNAKRPVTFSFNGGPGSSSVWLHLGVLGPKRVALDDEGHSAGPPGRLVANEFSLLDRSDLVFVDPVGTGFSRMVEGEKVNEYHEYKRDLESVNSSACGSRATVVGRARNTSSASPTGLRGPRACPCISSSATGCTSMA